MDNAGRLSAIIGDVYDAALDPALWPVALERAAGFVGSRAGCLMRRDVVRGTGEVFYGFGDQPRYRQLYFDKYVRFDPIDSALPRTDIGRVISNSDVTPRDEFLETRFYQEWMQPQGWFDNVFAPLARASTNIVAFAIARSEREDMPDNVMRQHLRLLVPHMRRAVLIVDAIGLRRTETATFTDAFDGLTAGVILTDAHGRIVHANATGEAMLMSGEVLRATTGRLTTGKEEEDRQLREILAAAGNGDVETKGTALPLVATDGQRYAVHILPLASGKRELTGLAHGAIAALFVHKAAMHPLCASEAIARTYRLTATELRVLLAIVEVGGVPEVADALGIAESTVKTHLGRVYEKTGTHRQADLVKILAGFSSPLHS